ncbi:hypothetical protein SH2C18_27950 [Clostridium sediminicola]|uniref:hypothetical protein n=1 Tax=Clostridium sediminicola TaxID=3114879 RepID=UPI0031F26920
MIKWIIYILGYVFWGIGASIVLNTHIGAGGWDALFANFSAVFGMSIGTWMIIITSITTLISSYLLKKLYFHPVIIGFFMGFIINGWNCVFTPLFAQISLVNNYLLFIIGMYIMSFGVGAQIYTKGMLPPVEFFVVTLRDIKDFNFAFIKTIVEIGAIIIALAVAYFGGIGTGQINGGTIIIAILIGPLVNLNVKIITKIFNGKGTWCKNNESSLLKKKWLEA